jgi:hypothetical protein
MRKLPIGVRFPIAEAKRSPNMRVAADFLLRQLRAEGKDSDLNNNSLLPAYIVSVCAAVENRLNRAYIDHFYRLVGDNYGQYTAPYIRLRIEEKLGMLIPLISNFKFEIDRKHERVLFLFKIFRLRNRLVHQVPYLVKAELEWIDQGRANVYYPKSEYEYTHSHPEWETVRRRDLVSIHASLKFWMRWLHNIADRINTDRYNHRGVLKQIGRRAGE